MPREREITVTFSEREATALWHVAGIAVQLLEEVEVSEDAPLHGEHDTLAAVARRLDHHLNCPEPPAPRTVSRTRRRR